MFFFLLAQRKIRFHAGEAEEHQGLPYHRKKDTDRRVGILHVAGVRCEFLARAKKSEIQVTPLHPVIIGMRGSIYDLSMVIRQRLCMK